MLPSFFIPVFFFGVNAVSFTAVSRLPGFPAVSYRDFIAPTAVFTAAFFPAQNTGIELVLDIVSGYFKKLMVMPIHRLAIILGRLSEAAIQAVLMSGIVLILLLIIGVRVKTGILGVLLLLVILTLFSMAWACISLIAALLTQNPRLVQSMFMIAFPMLYITTSQMPLGYLPHGYAQVVAANPATFVLEATRGLMIRGWSDPAIWRGLIAAALFFAVLLLLTLLSFRKVVK